ncbi:10070_t:CDS:2 [Ambispora gerdemannii]|uniref:10070_t:CDS:1 n=1 Tax=Ambispora gerdemannii TaxID=144530 RepID=A0A9N8W629_9GLOM|nr:10070_t:CDS:2 [Ambispora gerdemannii]
MVLYALFTACVDLVRFILTAILYPFTSQAAIVNTQSQRLLRNQDPRAAAAQFKREFEEKYGTIHPDFFEGSYAQALERAKRELQFLMVILQTDEHDHTARFNNETLTSQDLIRFLRDNDILVWVGNIRNKEAYMVNNKLEATTYPFVAIIVLQTSNGMNGKMVTVDRIEGLSTPNVLIDRLTNQINQHNPGLQHIRHERAERDAARQIREQQDTAYLMSLQADQEKERKAREAAEAERLKREHKKRKEEERKNLAGKKESWRRWALSQLPIEPAQVQDDVAQLVFKLPDGQRIMRNFDGSDSIETVYTFVDTYNLRKELSSLSSVPLSPPRNYVHSFDFLLVSPYPRTVHYPDKNKTIKEESELWTRAQLLVQRNVDESEEE